MADDITTATEDAPPIPTPVLTYLDEVKAGMDKSETAQLEATLAPKMNDGTLNENDVWHAQTEAQYVHDQMNTVHEQQHEQTLAVQSGDLAGAKDASGNAEYAMKVAESTTGGVAAAAAAVPDIVALQDVQYHETVAAGSGAWEQATAAPYVADAAASAASGNVDEAAASTATAVEHLDAAVDHSHDADPSAAVHVEPAPAETSGETTV